MSRTRPLAALVLGAFGSALTVLPWLHTVNHRDDHVHVDGAIVFVGHHDDEHQHGDDHEDEEEEQDEDAGWDHPEHHGPHARGALAHGAAFILAGAVFLFPPPGVWLERLSPPALPDAPALAVQHTPRATRGPPAA